jgi:hypothetical protein
MDSPLHLESEWHRVGLHRLQDDGVVTHARLGRPTHRRRATPRVLNASGLCWRARVGTCSNALARPEGLPETPGLNWVAGGCRIGPSATLLRLSCSQETCAHSWAPVSHDGAGRRKELRHLTGRPYQRPRPASLLPASRHGQQARGRIPRQIIAPRRWPGAGTMPLVWSAAIRPAWRASRTALRACAQGAVDVVRWSLPSIWPCG